jgi:hypothetical protein
MAYPSKYAWSIKHPKPMAVNTIQQHPDAPVKKIRLSLEKEKHDQATLQSLSVTPFEPNANPDIEISFDIVK